MLVVLDTNILVSALLSPFGPPSRVLDLVLAGDLVAAFDDRILAEYREVLARPKFHFAPEDVAAVFICLETAGEPVTARPLAATLPDPDDLPFLEVAAQTEAWLITGNADHFPVDVRGTARVLRPAEFLAEWQQRARI